MEVAKEVGEFLVYGVGVSYLGKRFIGDLMLKEGKKLISKSERNGAIWSHYQAQADGKGHTADSPLDCNEGKCRVFHQPALQVA